MRVQESVQVTFVRRLTAVDVEAFIAANLLPNPDRRREAFAVRLRELGESFGLDEASDG